jgi:eukaryotic-like serine/threonine-protein kinase
VIRLLRRGGALDVYDAWSDERDCRCVVKALRPDRRSDQGERKALLREGDLLLQLSHPHLVRAYDVVRGRRPALVLETLTGNTLGRLIEQNPRGFPQRDLVQLGIQLGSALRYLHRHGYLHLDVKPSNVVAQAGVAKLLDLSVARPPGRGHRGLGTPQYMSPEQVSGAPLTEAADAWGLGVVLYECATGSRPFRRTRREPVPPLRHQRKLPAALCEVIDACVQYEPSARAAVGEVVAALRGLV